MKIEFGTFASKRPQETGVNLTKMRASERRNWCKHLNRLDKSVYILLG